MWYSLCGTFRYFGIFVYEAQYEVIGGAVWYTTTVYSVKFGLVCVVQFSIHQYVSFLCNVIIADTANDEPEG